MPHINHIGMHDAPGDDSYNACFGCCLWPTFYAWMIWLGRMVNVHSGLLTCSSSTILVCMMHLGMTTAKHTLDAVCDLHFTHEWLDKDKWTFVLSRLLTSTILVSMHLGMTTATHALDAVFDLHFMYEWLGLDEWLKSIPAYLHVPLQPYWI